ncbi:hypothetical protein HCH15_08965 [Corynebacterium testudinoris]|uniref:Uncharacterized protein n=1 Tax=Corynebacterium testudinoris TaxID=136857 RepID=A0A0G3H8H8_9CORY|nr:hypothetical protein [Corynebacterium testudinoris]AKK09686.1 hypothetical protein CTEST_11390 [Corynebacterium testudinoris]MBX8996309.1 hypothetical protein [Corynebacterium testudinoris]
MTFAIPERTSVTLSEDLRARIATLPDGPLPKNASASDLISWLVERGVGVEEEASEMRAYAELGAEQAPFREGMRRRRNRRRLGL